MPFFKRNLYFFALFFDLSIENREQMIYNQDKEVTILPKIIFTETPDFAVQKRISRHSMPYMHHHNSCELFYIIKGEREYFIENEFFKLETGDLVFVPENALHRTDGKEASRILVYFSFEFLSEYLTTKALSELSLCKPLAFRPSEEQKRYIGYLFNTLSDGYAKSDRTTDDPALVGLLVQILFAITGNENAYSVRKYSDSRVESVVKYINENYGSISGIEEIASRFYLSKYHLCRLFNKNLGVSVVEYMNTIKIRNASLQMRDESRSITDIATACGFNSSSYFCKVFKAEKGVSPSEYRKGLIK